MLFEIIGESGEELFVFFVGDDIDPAFLAVKVKVQAESAVG